MTVAFFGHADTPSSVYPLLERKVLELAEQNKDITFLVGTHGSFDRMAQKALKQAIKRYPHIKAHIILAYYEPTSDKNYELPTLYPDGIENAPKRFAIDFRNRYMVNECDTVICYITRDWGGAAKFVRMSKKKADIYLILLTVNKG